MFFHDPDAKNHQNFVMIDKNLDSKVTHAVFISISKLNYIEKTEWLKTKIWGI